MRTLHRFRFLLLAVTGVALVAATVYTLNVSSGPGDVAGHIGPTPGPSSEGHIRAQRAYLDQIAALHPTEEAAALVSLEGYVPASKAQAIARSLQATWVFVRFPDAEQEPPFIVPSSMKETMTKRAGDRRKDLEAEVAALKVQATDAAGAQKTDLEDLIAQRQRELGKITPDCACVFAFAIEGASLQQLRDLARRPEVRLVDVPDPVTSDLAGWELAPIVPPAPGSKPV
jgi:hypothetical protein